jgi:hypothetical protein
MGPTPPASSIQLPGTTLPVAQFQLTNPGNNTANITSITLTGSGSGNFPTGITTVSLYLDTNANGVVDAGDQLLGTATYSGSTVTMNLNTAIPAGGTATYLAVYQFSNTAPAGTYTTQITSATGTNATGAVKFGNLPMTATTITIAIATSTPTATPTSTFTPTFTGTSTWTPTSTATRTPTPIEEDVVTNPYPNPVDDGPVNIDIKVPGPSTVQWSVFTISFRKIMSSQISINSTGTVQWNLTDKNGAKVSDGLYYIRIEVDGPQPLVKVYKVLVLH